MKLLFLNSLKGLKNKKIQMLAIILMIMLSTGIYTTMNLALDRLEDRYYKYLDSQNVEHISINSYVDYTKDITLDDINTLESKNLTDDEKQIINNYKCLINQNYCYNFFEVNEAFMMSVKTIFEKYDIDVLIEERKLDSIKDKYNFEYELNRSKLVEENNIFMKIIPYGNNMNKAYLIEGNYPKGDNEITILPNFAKIKNVEIGDMYKIGDKEYKVVGYAYAPDYIYPLVSFSSPIYDEKKNNIIYMNNDTYEKVNGVEDKTYSTIFKGESRKYEISTNDDDKTSNILKKEKDKIYMGTNTILRIVRIGSLQLEFATNRLFAKYFLYLLLTLSVVIIVIITKKRIDDERLQIGVLKSLGYNKYSIATSYLVYPIIGSIIGGLLGYLIGIILHYPLCKMYLSYFLVPLDNFKLDLNYLYECVITPLIFLSLLCYLVAILMLKKRPLDLLKEGSNLKVNKLSKLVNKITSKLSFKYKFKYSIAFRSIPKLLIIAITSFGAGLLIVLTLIGSDLMNNLVKTTFEGVDYKYSISTNISDKYYDNEAEYSLSYKMNLIKINDKKIDEEEITITGIDIDSTFVKILNSNKKNVIKKLKENEVIITDNMAKQLNIKINDNITYKINDKEFTFKVIDISNENMSLGMYIDRLKLSNILGYENNVYNTIMSNSSRYKKLSKLDKEEVDNINDVISVDDLKNSLKGQIQKYNSTIYIIILFSSVIALIIIGVIANIIVEENKKTISLMKVMGYKNKEISSILLNIYTPIIIVSYLISVPVMIDLLEKIVSALSGDINMTIPITISMSKVMIGLVGLLVAYFIAIKLSRKVLNKVPLAVALKRE